MGLLVSLLIAILIAGILFAIIQLFPIAQPFKNIVISIFLLLLLIWILGIATGQFPRFVW